MNASMNNDDGPTGGNSLNATPVPSAPSTPPGNDPGPPSFPGSCSSVKKQRAVTKTEAEDSESSYAEGATEGSL